ncbi:helix-turn-helix domain-containing protein [Clostridium beijerinckii]|uniref:helix-turn-helix domain-containing protein n=1 Tax=Clostridium beijerinckii TaxID=1520 RepID=UPI00232A7A4A|nr:helix-turn-helix domain-containing protein [Clostridium beijerinckii]
MEKLKSDNNYMSDSVVSGSIIEKSYENHLFDETTDGYIHVIRLNKDEKAKVRSTTIKGLREIIKETKGKTDTYIAPNTMYKPFRGVENIRQFRALYIDIDCEDGNQVWTSYKVLELVENKEIPKPTMLVNSGRGIHVYWRIINAPYGALHTWQELEDYLYHKLKPLGADRSATDGARVLRIPGTINSKNNKECKVMFIDTESEYSMYNLREEYLNYTSKGKQLEFNKVKNNTSSKVIANKFFNSYSLHMARTDDLITLCKLRNYNMKEYRNKILHCFAYWRGIYIRDEAELAKEVIDLNNSFKEPLKENEINSLLRCIPKAIDRFIAYEQGIRSGERKKVTKGMRDKEGYWYKNETLIELLDITPEEQAKLKTIIGTEEKYRRRRKSDNEYQKAKQKAKYRNEDGLTKTEIKRRNEFILIARMELQGMSLRAVAKELGKSVSTISEKLNKTYEKINYTEIKEEVANGCYLDMKIAI